jgi:RNA polymerase sigma factor (sigma-70 family)
VPVPALNSSGANPELGQALSGSPALTDAAVAARPPAKLEPPWEAPARSGLVVRQGARTALAGEAMLRRNIVDLGHYARTLLQDPVEAEDLVQDCLERVLVRRGPVPFWDMRQYLFAAARALCAHRGRSLGTAAVVLFADAATELVCQPKQDDRLTLRDIARGLAQLPPARREVIRLLVLEELSCRQVADRLQVPVGTVRSRVHRARAALRRHLDGERG